MLRNERKLRWIQGTLLGPGLCLLLALAASGHARAQKLSSPDRGSAPQTIPGLGATSFPTSTKSPEAQTAFLRGVLWLHVFEYPEAAEAFRNAEKLDPGFGMAYWGEAMTSNHGVWNQVDVSAGRAALERFAPTAAERGARMADPREKAYMAAVESLYDGQGTKRERDLRYAGAMQTVAQTFPKDQNAQLFYALALLSENEGVRDVPVYLQAASIAEAVFRVEPNNPGAAHYWIHGMDDPEHAAGALEAARTLSKIAPEAGHAQHMCSHIFIALGMWKDVVQSNLDAIRVVNLADRARGLPANGCGHYPYWLEYAYFQQGNAAAAQQTLHECERSAVDYAAWMKSHPGQPVLGTKVPQALDRRMQTEIAEMRNTAVVESRDWAAATGTAVSLSSLSPYSRAQYAFTTGLAAAERGDLDEASGELARLKGALGAMEGQASADPEDRTTLQVNAGELDGLIQVKRGEVETGVAELRRAASLYANMAFAFGPPVTVKPPAELLGEVLLQRGDRAGAQEAFQAALARAPGRAQSLAGLAEAQRLTSE